VRGESSVSVYKVRTLNVGKLVDPQSYYTRVTYTHKLQPENFLNLQNDLMKRQIWTINKEVERVNNR
jgi:hypothetical protein